jgi:hypothetical protein
MSKKRPPAHRTAAKAVARALPAVKATSLARVPEPPKPEPKAVAVEPVPVVAPKGFTRAGTPRERAYRTYFGVTEAGQVIKYKNYDAREIDVRNGSVRRITAHEARTIESEGARPSPLIVTTQWTPSAGGPASSQPQQVANAGSGSTPPGVVEAMATMRVILSLVGDLQKKIQALGEETED